MSSPDVDSSVCIVYIDVNTPDVDSCVYVGGADVSNPDVGSCVYWEYTSLLYMCLYCFPTSQIVSLYDEEEIRRLISLLLKNSEEKVSDYWFHSAPTSTFHPHLQWLLILGHNLDICLSLVCLRTRDFWTILVFCVFAKEKHLLLPKVCTVLWTYKSADTILSIQCVDVNYKCISLLSGSICV